MAPQDGDDEPEGHKRADQEPSEALTGEDLESKQANPAEEDADSRTGPVEDDEVFTDFGEILRIIDSGATEPIQSLPLTNDELDRRERELDIRLKREYARKLMRMLIVQLALADGVFIAYAWAGRDWDIPPAVISIWLSATLVEVLGVVWVVTSYLFPRRDA